MFCILLSVLFFPALSFALEIIVNPPVKPVLNRMYVGAEMCRSCHSKQWEIWKNSTHATGYVVLPEKEKNNPACLRCHVTGFGRFSGYVFGKTTYLEGVQCESCHGEGNKHIAPGSEKHSSIVGVKKKCGCDVRIVCMGCHNEKHSPGFDYEVFWEKVKH